MPCPTSAGPAPRPARAPPARRRAGRAARPGARPAGGAWTRRRGLAAAARAPRWSRGFDPPDPPWGAGHRGVDLAGRVGQPVRAALAGRSLRRRLAGRGVVVVDHGATRTTYEPVAAPVRGRRRGAPPGRSIGALALVGSHCFPARVPALGVACAGDDLPRPAAPRGRRPVRLLPLQRRDPSRARAAGHCLRLPLGPPPSDRPGAAPVRPLAAAGARGGAPAAPQLRRAGGPAGRPCAAGRW